VICGLGRAACASAAAAAACARAFAAPCRAIAAWPWRAPEPLRGTSTPPRGTIVEPFGPWTLPGPGDPPAAGGLPFGAAYILASCRPFAARQPSTAAASSQEVTAPMTRCAGQTRSAAIPSGADQTSASPTVRAGANQRASGLACAISAAASGSNHNTGTHIGCENHCTWENRSKAYSQDTATAAVASLDLLPVTTAITAMTGESSNAGTTRTIFSQSGAPAAQLATEANQSGLPRAADLALSFGSIMLPQTVVVLV
jgi:hypothetical protein